MKRLYLKPVQTVRLFDLLFARGLLWDSLSGMYSVRVDDVEFLVRTDRSVEANAECLDDLKTALATLYTTYPVPDCQLLPMVYADEATVVLKRPRKNVHENT